MGLAMVSVLRGASEDTIVGAAAAAGCDAIGRDLGEVHGLASMGVLVQSDVPAAILGADVVIDFSTAAAVAELAKAASRAGVALVSGTTALGADAEAALQQAAQKVPVLWAPNFSLGIHVLAQAVRLVAARLGSSFDIELVEAHHRGKLDAPSGTALRLMREAQQARGPLTPVFARHERAAGRGTDEVGVLALRGGDVVGDHSVHFLGQGERLELTHRATSREMLARGAVTAARGVLGRAPGRYSLDDVIGA
jgi:4-hydroxy-tetrahydrodipicolinate reductase